MIAAVVRLLLVLGILAGIGGLGWTRGQPGEAVALGGGALLLAGLFAGKVAAGLRLPKLTGYLVIGFLIGPSVIGLIPDTALDGLALVKGLAVSLIALAAGTELSGSLVRRMGFRVAAQCVVVSGTVFAAITGAVMLLRPLLPFMASMSTLSALCVSALSGAVLCSFSVTVTIAIITELRSKGPLTEYLLAFVVIGDLLILVGFAVAVAATRASFGGHLSVGALLEDVGWELFGSVLVGALLGLGMRLFVRRVGRDLAIFVGAVCFLSAELGLQLHLSPLLTSLSAGALLANVDPKGVHRVAAATETVSLPVFAVFFAAAGAGLHVQALRVMGPIAVLLVALRAGLIFASTRFALPKREEGLRRRLWMGLVSQAGVTFGLAAMVSRSFPTFGPQLETLFVAVVSLHELVGPILTRRALAASGEIGAATVPDAV